MHNKYKYILAKKHKKNLLDEWRGSGDIFITVKKTGGGLYLTYQYHLFFISR